MAPDDEQEKRDDYSETSTKGRRGSAPLQSGVIKPCPFCGSVAEHESTVTEEVIRCTGCPAQMIYDGSGEALMAMWNERAL